MINENETIHNSIKPPLIVLTGPTAVGKSELSIALAKNIDGSIISADSMQVYKGMDIGSAKITRDEMQGISHYLIDVLDPREAFHVVRFQEMAKEAIEQIYASGKIPILVGGTGFYIQAVLYDIDFTSQDEDEQYRMQLEAIAEEKGNEYLHDMLKEVDPKSASAIHPNNRKRVIRALEFYQKSGSSIADHNEEQRQNESPYNFMYFVLNDDRDLIYDRINLRVDKMMEAGLVNEVLRLKNAGCTRDMISMQGLGYKEILDALDGTTTMDQAVYLIKRDTRHFAKRQLTWFRREHDVTWINRPDFQNDETQILQYMVSELKKKEIISE